MLVTSSCHGCSKDFALRELSDHMQFCPGALDLQDLESDDDFVSDVSVRNSENQTAASTSVSFQNDIDWLIITDQSDVEAGKENATNTETIIYVINFSTSNSATVNAIIHENNSSITSSTDNSSSATPSNDTDCPISVIVTKAIEYCRKGNISDPVEILKKLQDVIVTGRPVEVEDITVCAEGDTNIILVDRINVLSTGMDEISVITNLSPQCSAFMSPNILEDLFNSTETSPCIVKLRNGLESLGLLPGGRREAGCLESVLQFITSTDEEPVLGFNIPANIRFTSSEFFFPTANTCINC
ncbi:hypothetical protein CHS0354_017240 [Potamilus streckersoni]|uniref:Uncharacterized protein n=1 Tax=Potamilus streckersoni TaxID=2493646 RepID=A0AAE0RYV7_9BIVA|nr:hypothetical protein CHS0354_017240 [Potamilus streckersoni]